MGPAGWLAVGLAQAAAWLEELPGAAWAGFVQMLRVEAPELLRLLAGSLSRARVPASLAEARRFGTDDWLAAAPVLAGAAACAVMPLALALGDHAKAAALRDKQRRGPDAVDLRDCHWLTREMLLRGMGLCYLCGFLVSATQHRALWGSLGLSPIARDPHGRPTPAFALLEGLGLGYGDWQLELVSWLGTALALQMMLGRFRSFVIPAALWCLYLSIVNLQAPFTYSYGWEWLTCEVGFLVIFICPCCARGLASWTPPPRLVLWLIRWCAFRLLLGAGLSKVGRNSSACWRQLTCTSTHYYTQPIPNPLSWYMHHLPEDLHKVEVALTFFEQLVLPFFMLVPVRACRLLAAVLEIGFQLMIVGTGNYAWINFIGALPCIALLDDAALSWPCPRRSRATVSAAASAALLQELAPCKRLLVRCYRGFRQLAYVALVMFMVFKSKDPLKELFGPAPWINNYDELFLMNSQGVFGFINQHRVQVVLQYTHDPDPAGPHTEWRPLDFKCLPGSLDRMPCFVSPFHYRLDWETWIRITAGGEGLLKSRAPAEAYHRQLGHQATFLESLVVRILSGDDDSVSLMGVPRQEVYKDGQPPTAISIDFASYTFTSPSDSSGAWWVAEPVADNSRRVYGAEGTRLPAALTRKSPPERPLLLGLCAAGAAGALELVAAGGARRTALGVLAAVAVAHAFSLALAVDYEGPWQATMASLMPLAGRLPACDAAMAGPGQRRQCLLAYTSACVVPYGLALGMLCCGALRGARRAAADDEGEAD